MSETEKKLLTVNEYAAENHVSRQSVNSKINRHKDELKGHVFIINGRKMLDGFAQDFLKPTKDNALLAKKNADLENTLSAAKFESSQSKKLANTKENKIQSLTFELEMKNRLLRDYQGIMDEMEKCIIEKNAVIAEKDNRISELTDKANIPTHYVKTKLEMLDEANQNFAVRYLADFYENSGDTIGLLLYGDVGTGKSFLASCLANDMLSKGYSVRWLSAMQIVEQGAFYSDEDYRRYVDDIIRPDVLIIDDLGAERGTEFAMERVFSLVDTRVSSDKPLIVTTNVDINAMGQCPDLRRKRTFDRVLSATFPYVMRGVSRRMRSARENFDRYKDRFFSE